MDLTSVVIPACNEEQYIGKTIKSYSQQRFRESKVPYELIVVVNGSSDDTGNIAEDLGARVIELEQAGVSVARNVGVEHANGEILIFNDADTRVATNYVATISRAIERGFDYGSAWFKPENLHPVTFLYSLLTWGSGFVLGDVGGNMYVRRDSFEKAHGFDPSLSIGEDTDLGRRMKTAGARHTFLHSTYVVTSMRKFEENGYCKELFVNQIWPYAKQTFLPSSTKKQLGGKNGPL
ncbi:glycosyltransferase [Candidatus Woesearchaeota archaeon]|nr:glycosyltransferase [Candidatus Woesearchaeota archaeon]